MSAPSPGEAQTNCRTAVLATCTALVLVILSIPFLAGAFRPWPDQAFTLEAALRHSRGEGLTTSIDSSTTDITSIEYRRLTYFPPLYPLLVSVLLRAGLTVTIAVKGLNLAALVIGSWFWIRLASRHLPPWWCVVFAVLLPTAGGGTIPTGGTTDYVYWALVPAWLLAMENALTGSRPMRGVILAASIVAALIGFRWASTALVPSGVLAIVLTHWRQWRTLISKAFVYGAIPTACFAAISLANRMAAGRATVLSYTSGALHPELLLTSYPVDALFAMPLGLHAVLLRVMRAAGASPESRGAALLLSAVSLAMLVALTALRRTNGERPSPTFAILTWSTLGFLIVFLGVMTLKYSWGGTRWSYLVEPRYYRPFWPLAALFWLRVASVRRYRNALLTAFALIGLYLLQGSARIGWGQLQTKDTSLDRVAKVLEVRQRPGVQVVFDVTNDDYLLHASDRFVPRLLPAPEGMRNLHASREANVWLVRRVGYREAYAEEADWSERKFRAMAAVLEPKLTWRSADGSQEIHHARVRPGALDSPSP